MCVRARASFPRSLQEHEAGSPQYRLRLWEAAFKTPSYTALFAPPEHTLFKTVLPCSRALALDRAFSKSYVARLPADAQAALRLELEAVLDKGEGMRPIAGPGREPAWFEYPYETEVVVMRRKAA